MSGRTVVVTGAARGIGLTIARRFWSAGDNVGLVDIDGDSLESAVKEFQPRESIFGCPADVSSTKSVEEAFRQIKDRWGSIDVLVNNARAGVRASLIDETASNWDITTGVILKGAFLCSQTAIKYMADQEHGGAIVNISSVASRFSCALSPSYHAAKAGLDGLTRYLAVHAGGMKVRVNSVLPGFIVQDEHQERYNEPSNGAYRAVSGALHPGGRVGTSGEVAELVYFLASPQASFLSGESIVLDGACAVQGQADLLLKSISDVSERK